MRIERVYFMKEHQVWLYFPMIHAVTGNSLLTWVSIDAGYPLSNERQLSEKIALNSNYITMVWRNQMLCSN